MLSNKDNFLQTLKDNNLESSDFFTTKARVDYMRQMSSLALARNDLDKAGAEAVRTRKVRLGELGCSADYRYLRYRYLKFNLTGLGPYILPFNENK